MDQGRTGQRLLLALMSQDADDNGGDGFLSEEVNVHGILLAIGSILVLVIVIAMCACNEGKSKSKNQVNGKGDDYADEDNIQLEANLRSSDPVENGGPTSNRNSANMSKHSRQASSASGSNIRPASTNLRELPEPPVDSHHHPHHHHHSRNTSSSGITVLPPPPPPPPPSTSPSNAVNGVNSVADGGGGCNSSKEESEYGASVAAASSSIMNGSLNLDSSQLGDPDSNVYDHFKTKSMETPPGYDQLGNVKIGRIGSGGVSGSSGEGGQDVNSPSSETSGVVEVGGGMDGRRHHYSQPKERMYDVVKDVKKDPIQLFRNESQLKEEDPYNQIGDSDNTLTNSVIKRIKQSVDPDDLYATIQGDSDGSFAVVAAQQAAMSKGQQPSSVSSGNNNKNNSGTSKSKHNSTVINGGTSPSDPSFIPPSTSSTPSTPPGDDEAEEEDEYAVVQKPSGRLTPTRNRQQPQQHLQQGKKKNGEDDGDDDGSISPYNTYRPPEPPRMYGHYAESGDIAGHLKPSATDDGHDDDDDDFYEDGLRPSGAKEHMYSKVTARESLASMSARYALNPYETVPDLPENMYATVEGGSGDGVIPEVTMRHRQDRMTSDENRLSQNSDTYAEIGISGGGLTTSVISNTSTSSNSNNNGLTILGTSSGSSGGGGGGGGAPIPPSLDSLHQMTKSQTSSEGDRLSDRMSDRYLASPDDWIIPGQLDSIGGGQHNHIHHQHHHYHRADGSDDESYGTLTRTSGGGESSSNANNYDNNNGNGSNRSSTGRIAGVGGMINGRQGTVTDVESGEVTPILTNNYETVEDSATNGRQFVFRGDRGNVRARGRDLDSEENDPNYESVDETRAKVALLKAKESGNISPSSPTYATPQEIRNNKASKSSALSQSMSSTTSSSSSPAPHISVVKVFKKDDSDNGFNLNSSSSSMSSPPVSIDRPNRRTRRPNHDYEEVDLSPPSSPLHSHHHHPQLQQHLSTSAPVETSDSAVRERVLNSHTYEELPQVKLSKRDEKRKSDRSKKQHSSSSTSEERKKSKEEKKKFKQEEKKKAAASSSAEGSSGASWDGSKKSDSWETNRTRL